MLFRVDQTKDRFGTVVSVAGQLIEKSVHVVEDCCSTALSSGKPVFLYLQDVSEIDDAGRNLLRDLSERGVRLLASGVYMSHLVASLQSPRTAARAPSFCGK